MPSDEECYKNNSDLNKTYTSNQTSYKSRSHISITPQLIRATVKRLQMRRLYVSSDLISKHFRRSYPVERNVKKFDDELKKRLDCAVRAGLLLRHGENAYYLPTLRQGANALRTAFTVFWEDILKSLLDCPEVGAEIAPYQNAYQKTHGHSKWNLFETKIKMFTNYLDTLQNYSQLSNVNALFSS